MMHEMGIETGIDNDALHEAVLLLQQYVHAPIVSHLCPCTRRSPASKGSAAQNGHQRRFTRC